mmetsp:Transcript_34381/g.110960  ORF Transcript_34381/g.110960 Transcript_34381/m.110960 type:complete len:219 (-) Transcript_34381:217-873(-)
MRLGRRARHEHDRSRAVGDGGGVCGRDGAAVLLKGRLGAGRRLRSGRKPVVGTHDYLPLASVDRDGRHLVREGGGVRPAVRLICMLVLHRLGQPVRICAQLGVPAHVAVPVGIPQAIMDHSIYHGCVAHPRAEAGIRKVVRNLRHALHASRHDNVGLAEHNLLSAEDNGLHARRANLVDRGAAGGFWKSSSQGRLAGGCLADPRADDISHPALLDQVL